MAPISWSNLPPELTDHIFRRSMGVEDLARCTLVCTTWRSIIGNIWGHNLFLLGSVNTTSSSRRIQKEYLDFKKDPPKGCKVRLVDSLFHWEAIMIGPPHSPYAGGVFFLNIRFIEGYPFHPPHVHFQTKVYHPNIGSNGRTCIAKAWSPVMTIFHTLITIYARFSDPDTEDPFDHKIAHIYKTQRSQYEEEARAWTKKYATASQKNATNWLQFLKDNKILEPNKTGGHNYLN